MSFKTDTGDAVGKQAGDAIKPGIVNNVRWKLWKECLHHFKGFPSIATEVEDIVQVARQVDGDGFLDLIQEGGEELIEGQQVLTVEELEELVKSSLECEGEHGEHEPASWNLQQFSQLFQVIKHTNDLIANFDLSMECSCKIIHGFTDILRPSMENVDEFK